MLSSTSSVQASSHKLGGLNTQPTAHDDKVVQSKYDQFCSLLGAQVESAADGRHLVRGFPGEVLDRRVVRPKDLSKVLADKVVEVLTIFRRRSGLGYGEPINHRS